MSYKLGIMKIILKISSVVLLVSTFLLGFSSNNVIKIQKQNRLQKKWNKIVAI
mgnify:CR=1 FL=1